MSEKKFSVGDRVQVVDKSWPVATVIEVKADGGFTWQFDKPHSLGARHGVVNSGETYGHAEALAGWELVRTAAAAEAEAEISHGSVRVTDVVSTWFPHLSQPLSERSHP
jgi:hypothetical protein